MGERLTVYNYENVTYHVTGMSVINDQKDTKQEGILIYMQHARIGLQAEFGIKEPPLIIFLDKRSCAHIAKTTQQGRKYWNPFKLPKMVEQTQAYCRKCKKYTPHEKGKCILHEAKS